ncbi:MAG: hypothetical protein RSA91_01010 [Bacilli bacterium]
MARKTETTKKEKVYCTGCDKEKTPGQFYKSYGATQSGLLPYCKECIIEKSLNGNGEIDSNKFKKILMQVDRPYLHKNFIDNFNKHDLPKSVIGFYFKDLGLKDYRPLKYSDSIFDVEEKNNKTMHSSINIPNEERFTLVDKWGFGYSDEELYMFEKKFNLLKDNYPLRTAMHIEALCTYARYRVKEEMATAKGNVGEAQKWGSLADKAAQSAKINPSQLSKADLSGGLNGFGELARAVEKAKDIIDVLPRFKERPQDKIDYTLWCYVNYVRRLRNLPDAEYKEIYKFLDDRKKEYKKEKNKEFEFED